MTDSQSTPSIVNNSRLTQLASSFIDSRPASSRSCFVLGATGETGKRITRNLINSGAFSLIKLISRSQVPVDYVPEAPAGVTIEHETIANFDSITEDSQIFQNCDFGFCALGSTKAKAGGAEQFFKTDHDLPLRLLRIAKSSGCKYVALISSAGASPTSTFLYPKTKGQLETDLIALDFDALRIYRPAMIQVRRKEERIVEEIGLILAPIFDFCSFGRAAIKIEVLADSIVKDALLFRDDQSTEKVLFYNNQAIKADR